MSRQQTTMFSDTKFAYNGNDAGSHQETILTAVEKGVLANLPSNGSFSFLSRNEWVGNDTECVRILAQLQQQSKDQGDREKPIHPQPQADDGVDHAGAYLGFPLLDPHGIDIDNHHANELFAAHLQQQWQPNNGVDYPIGGDAASVGIQQHQDHIGIDNHHANELSAAHLQQQWQPNNGVDYPIGGDAANVGMQQHQDRNGVYHRANEL